MTVEELIKQLQQFDLSLTVILGAESAWQGTPTHFEEVTDDREWEPTHDKKVVIIWGP